MKATTSASDRDAVCMKFLTKSGTSLPEFDLKLGEERYKEAVKRVEENDKSIREGITDEVQALFDSLAKQYNLKIKDFTLKKLHHLVILILEQYCLKNILIISIAIIMDFL